MVDPLIKSLYEVYHAAWHLMDNSCHLVSDDVMLITMEDYEKLNESLNIFEEQYPDMAHGEFEGFNE